MTVQNRWIDTTATPAWHMQAACAGDEPEQWFPHPGEIEAIEDAKAVCADCPVRADCGIAAIDAHDRHGIRAGFNLGDRLEWGDLHAWLGLPVPLGSLPDTEPRTIECAGCGDVFVTRRASVRQCPPCEQGLVAAEPSVTRVEKLRGAGWTNARIIRATGLGKRTVQTLTPHRRWVNPETERRILAVEVPEVVSV